MLSGHSFTRGVRHCLIAAREEAERLGRDEVGPEHILLGVLAVPGALPSHIALALELDTASLRADVERDAGRGAAPSGARPDLPYTAASKRVLEHAMGEATRLDADDVDGVHLFLGLLAEADGIAADVFRRHGVALEAAREVVAAVQPPVALPPRSIVRRFVTWLRGDSETTPAGS